VPLILAFLLQKANLTVEATLKGSYNLVVGLNCSENGDCNASGDLYVDSNIIFNFSADGLGLGIQSNCTEQPPYILQNISVYGLKVTACLNISVYTNTEASCTVTEGNQVLEITNLQIDLCKVGRISWEVTNKTQPTTTRATPTTSATETSTKTEVTTETTETQTEVETEASTEPESATGTGTTEPEIG
jgi:hypothetical protein